MPDTITPTHDAGTGMASTIDPAERLWRSVQSAHAAFNGEAERTEKADPLWEGPQFAVLSKAVQDAESALIDLRTTSRLGILRKLELLLNRGHDGDDERIVGALIRDLSADLRMPPPTTGRTRELKSAADAKPLPLGPAAMVSEIVKAARAGGADGAGWPFMVRALAPWFASYTVADAVHMLGMLRTIGNAVAPDDGEEDETDADVLGEICTLLERFACMARPSGPECVMARGRLMELVSTEDDEWGLAEEYRARLARRVHDDAKAMRSNLFRPETVGDASTRGAQTWLSWLSQVVQEAEGLDAAAALADGTYFDPDRLAAE
jgi:hypothetical protein